MTVHFLSMIPSKSDTNLMASCSKVRSSRSWLIRVTGLRSSRGSDSSRCSGGNCQMAPGRHRKVEVKLSATKSDRGQTRFCPDQTIPACSFLSRTYQRKIRPCDS